MKLYLAGQNYHPWIEKGYFDFYRLESYFNIINKEKELIPKYKSFILDSGAFSYMNGEKVGDINWDKYIEEYAEFIKKYQVKYYMELDIDSIVGYNEVKRLRKKLEQLTGIPSIPVWHKSRGIKEWIQMVKSYDYVAIGGIVTKEIPATEYKYFTWLLRKAKEHNCKVHGLGFTNIKGIHKYPFYSVDSTSWTSGNRFGGYYQYTGRNIVKKDIPKGYKTNGLQLAKHNFKEWLKFQRYADLKL